MIVNKAASKLRPVRLGSQKQRTTTELIQHQPGKKCVQLLPALCFSEPAQIGMSAFLVFALI